MAMYILIMCLDPTWFNRGYFVVFGFHVVYRGCKSRGLIVLVLFSIMIL